MKRPRWRRDVVRCGGGGVSGSETRGQGDLFGVGGQFDAVSAGTVWVGGRVVTERSEPIGPAPLEFGFLACREPVVEELLGACERGIDRDAVVAVQEPPMVPIGGADFLVWRAAGADPVRGAIGGDADRRARGLRRSRTVSYWARWLAVSRCNADGDRVAGASRVSETNLAQPSLVVSG